MVGTRRRANRGLLQQIGKGRGNCPFSGDRHLVREDSSLVSISFNPCVSSSRQHLPPSAISQPSPPPSGGKPNCHLPRRCLSELACFRSMVPHRGSCYVPFVRSSSGGNHGHRLAALADSRCGSIGG